MRVTRSGAVWLLLAWPVAAWAEEVPEAQPVEEEQRSLDDAWRSLLRLDATTWALLPRAGVGTARYLGAAEVRWRFLGGKLYALDTGGTLLFPTSEGTLRPGAFASVGLGVDHAR
ncbi:hypothetical protein D7V97_00675 [Corallococcus sp. CA053C]|uniref:hypothetical protein n=1 Tax=Corallococcus sp. CA053C TaxID=2316732 RepID=UPI000EA29549|nr:hypothetical protein [Corallococcus sp. CA053C]RKH15352.1 hypothetical protein D7V97_00675 [Corallococcus sp. CA053C]